ncbi:uncharacterized protein LOC126796143 [Argentina anserina]|uniref:uncharacterized protein LOC126796143 n=1 Tax=Argentina anserina TaxID=57926 RepID=UPI0021766CD2|nr:uncharacterized protein LOC126796143 [Potentilla anserina]
MSVVPGTLAIYQLSEFGVVWQLCSSVETAAAQMIPPSDDALMIRFMFYKETMHSLATLPDGEVLEVWMIPGSPTKAITVRPSEFHHHNAETIAQTPSGHLMMDFVQAHIPPRLLAKIVPKIIHLVQSSIGSDTKGFVDVRLCDTIAVKHHLKDDEAIRDSMRGYFKATRCGTCAICLDDYEIEYDDGVRLPCLHCFHGPCISKWLVVKPSCPICSHPLLSPDILLPWFNPPVQDGIFVLHSSI